MQNPLGLVGAFYAVMIVGHVGLLGTLYAAGRRLTTNREAAWFGAVSGTITATWIPQALGRLVFISPPVENFRTRWWEIIFELLTASPVNLPLATYGGLLVFPFAFVALNKPTRATAIFAAIAVGAFVLCGVFPSTTSGAIFKTAIVLLATQGLDRTIEDVKLARIAIRPRQLCLVAIFHLALIVWVAGTSEAVSLFIVGTRLMLIPAFLAAMFFFLYGGNQKTLPLALKILLGVVLMDAISYRLLAERADLGHHHHAATAPVPTISGMPRDLLFFQKTTNKNSPVTRRWVFSPDGKRRRYT